MMDIGGEGEPRRQEGWAGTNDSFVCPACRAALTRMAEAYQCASCGRAFPILFGIPDFRLRPDRYLSLEEERAKAGRLHAFAQHASFDALVRYYYEITGDVPPELAVRYRGYILGGPRRAGPILDALRPCRETDTLVDLGCGSGGLLVAAAGRYRAVYGVDIALRWLVICRKHLEEKGIEATLVCADVEALPFPDGMASHAVAADLVEHVYSIASTAEAIQRLLQPGGKLWLCAANRYCIGPHASTRIWGISLLPRRARSWLLRRLKGIDLLRNSNLVSPAGLARLLRARGFAVEVMQPRQIAPGTTVGNTAGERFLLALYRKALRLRPLRSALLLVGPAFELLCRTQTSLPAGPTPAAAASSPVVRGSAPAGPRITQRGMPCVSD